ncbi:MAG: 30S ribosomal protein S15 [Candidatus Shikimatogenerans bostrichidophilus]|nr:MAG: 30S ribosomal protein S15 [Candidatus Shikimatogenerans bostrichidophilus]
MKNKNINIIKYNNKDYYYINQIILFTNKILKLNKHLKKNNKDYNTERSLIKVVSKRRKILKYIKNKYIKLYLIIKKKFNLKK